MGWSTGRLSVAECTMSGGRLAAWPEGGFCLGKTLPIRSPSQGVHPRQAVQGYLLGAATLVVDRGTIVHRDAYLAGPAPGAHGALGHAAT